jgi:glutamate 5-kinase
MSKRKSAGGERHPGRDKKRGKILERWVIKSGSNIVCSGGPLLLRAWMQQVAALRRDHQIEVVWVTSGAIASAELRTQFEGKTASISRDLAEKQALSAIGQPIVMDLYNLALQSQGLLGAQILLTYDDLAHIDQLTNFKHTVEKLLQWGVTPILNENDAVATEEINFGDNDSLSAKVAHALRADRLVILTDVEGLYNSDPREFPDARLIWNLAGVDEELLTRAATWGRSKRGMGGMYSKLKAAREANQNGIDAYLAKGDMPQVLVRLAQGESLGTRICAKSAQNGRRSTGKK